MDETLPHQVARAGRQLSTGVITASEFMGEVMLILADDQGVSTALAASLVAALPKAVRGRLRDVVRDVLRPEFRCPTWPIVGRPQEPEAVLTAGLKAWARALVEHLDDDADAD